MKKIKVAISYRVLQSWRVPIFERLAKQEGIDIKVFYGEDFEGTKVVSYKGDVDFKSESLSSMKLSFGTSNGKGYIPFSPSLYSKLKDYNPDIILCEGASNLLNNIVCFTYSKLNNKILVQWGLGEIKGRKVSSHRKLANIFFGLVEKFSNAAIAYSRKVVCNTIVKCFSESFTRWRLKYIVLPMF